MADVAASPATAASSPSSPSPGTDYVASLLGRRLRLSVVDGRIFEGLLVCTDRDCNIILSHTDEIRGAAKRYMSLVYVPGRHITKIQLENAACAVA
ncbi:hypothetical protein RI367_001082 [Sorochytrium milnesiophthora]